MKYSFTCKGHPNILGTHATTLEFTKDTYLTPRGDCILGIHATFSLAKLTPFLTASKIVLTLEVNNYTDTLCFKPNLTFSSDHELVIRMTTFCSDRTLGLDATKSAKMISRDLVTALKNSTTTLEVTLENASEK